MFKGSSPIGGDLYSAPALDAPSHLWIIKAQMYLKKKD